MSLHRGLTVFAALAAVLFAASCADQPMPPELPEVPGFFWGLLHGVIAPFALVGGIFSDMRIYAFPNSGWWYDLGFLLGLIPWGLFGKTAD